MKTNKPTNKNSFSYKLGCVLSAVLYGCAVANLIAAVKLIIWG